MATVCQLRPLRVPGRHSVNGASGRRQLRVLLAATADCDTGNWLAQLAGAGHVTVAVGDADTMLDALSDDRFDVVLLDLALPEALETAKLYRFLSLGERSVPIVGLARTASEMRRHHAGVISECLALQAGAPELAALEAMLHTVRCVSPDRNAVADVVSIETHRKLRERRGA
jgi:CheY-like chemotaxis protein